MYMIYLLLSVVFKLAIHELFGFQRATREVGVGDNEKGEGGEIYTQWLGDTSEFLFASEIGNLGYYYSSGEMENVSYGRILKIKGLGGMGRKGVDWSSVCLN